MIHRSDAGSSTRRSDSLKPLLARVVGLNRHAVGDAYDAAAAESFMGLYKAEAIAAGSPFRISPLRTVADIETITMNYVDWSRQPPPAQPAHPRHTRGIRAGLLCCRNRLTIRGRRQQEDGMKTGTVHTDTTAIANSAPRKRLRSRVRAQRSNPASG